MIEDLVMTNNKANNLCRSFDICLYLRYINIPYKAETLWQLSLYFRWSITAYIRGWNDLCTKKTWEGCSSSAQWWWIYQITPSYVDTNSYTVDCIFKYSCSTQFNVQWESIGSRLSLLAKPVAWTTVLLDLTPLPLASMYLSYHSNRGRE